MKNIIFECLRANQDLKKNNLVKLTWGNVSCRLDKEKIVIKPSGVNFDELKPEDMSIVDINSGICLSGLKPSVDTNIHIEIYKKFLHVNSIIHTHSKFATAWAQANKKIPILGTTHADYFDDDVCVVPCEIIENMNEYEKQIGLSVVRYIQDNNINPKAVLLENHGVLVFTDNLKHSMECAIVLEEVAEMAMITLKIDKDRKITEKNKNIFKKHFLRKNGDNKYYGQ